MRRVLLTLLAALLAVTLTRATMIDAVPTYRAVYHA